MIRRLLKTAIIIVMTILMSMNCEWPSQEQAIMNITFPDPNFEAAIREALEIPTGDITLEDLSSLRIFSAEVNQIADITGIEYCANLFWLLLGGNQIVDISPLSGLTHLKYASFPVNQIVDISPLSELANLRILHLYSNQIDDLMPLSDLTNLSELYLQENQIVDIFPLVQNSGINEGDWIDIENNPLSDISINTYIPQLEARGVIINY